MWIFTSKGFVSMVQDFNNPGNLLVRARNKAHLEALFPEEKIQETRLNDYRFRISIPAVKTAEFFRDQIQNIDYNNFKNSIPEDRYHDAAADTWQIMYNYQRGTP